jgi:trimeric autotransporter adhesin
MKTCIPAALITFSLTCFAFLPAAEAVNPPPDGGYPNFTTAEGTNALQSLTTGSANTAVGWYSLFSTTEGSFNTATGAGALLSNTANENTAFGAAALLFNIAGFQNTAVGAAALLNNSGFSVDAPNGGPGSANTAVGARALLSNTTGGANTANGADAHQDNTTGFGNTVTGAFALTSNTTGNNNTALGNVAGVSITGNGNVCIGSGVSGEAGVDDSTYIRNVNTLIQNFSAGVNDYVTVRLSDGRLGHTAVVSSQRYKHDIKPLATTSEALYALKPVSFRLKKEFDATQALGFGLIAEEVEKVDPALVYRNAKGQVESVRYEMVNAMLLNEFLKEHRKNEEQEATITELKSTVAQQQKYFQATVAHQQKQIDALTAGLQKVSAQLEFTKPGPKTVLSDQ